MLTERDPIALTIAGYAAVVSTAVFAWTLYSYKKDRSEVTVNAEILVTSEPDSSGQVEQDSYALDKFYPNSATGKDWAIKIRFANAGRRPVTITGWAAVRSGHFDYPPSESFSRPVTLQESETEYFFLHSFDAFRRNTEGFAVNDSHGKSWHLPAKQVKQIQKLMLDHKL